MKNKNNKLRLFIILIAFFATNCFALDVKNNSELSEFIQKVSKDRQLSPIYLQHVFTQAKKCSECLQSIQAPFEIQPWQVYQKHFLTPERIRAGVKYWNKHITALRQAEKIYGVPVSIIVAIVGIESFYGRADLNPKKQHRALDALSTLAFYYPPRSEYFRHELEEYLLLTKELKQNPSKIYGSYAGAIGLPQFMPSSYRHFAISYWKHTYPDLIHDSSDVVVSIANYLKSAGWVQGAPIAIRANLVGDYYRQILSLSGYPEFTLSQLENYGVTLPTQLNKDYLAALIQLENFNGYEYWVVFPNFHAILRYNNSVQYAMTAMQLAEKIKRAKYSQHTMLH
ncbi:MAG: lytic murein transglycosylase B [Gammaproteobacteria bacterium]|nr:lytic murein transglycosylase B [Gammaproteobacteria bacterium]